MTLLQTLQGILMLLDGCLELLDVLCPPLTKGGLSLTVALLPLLGCCVDLIIHEPMSSGTNVGAPTGFLPPFLFCTCAVSWVPLYWSGPSNSWEESEKDSSSTSTSSVLGGGTGGSFEADIMTCRGVAEFGTAGVSVPMVGWMKQGRVGRRGSIHADSGSVRR